MGVENLKIVGKCLFSPKVRKSGSPEVRKSEVGSREVGKSGSREVRQSECGMHLRLCRSHRIVTRLAPPFGGWISVSPAGRVKGLRTLQKLF